jgi:hypothetical protein
MSKFKTLSVAEDKHQSDRLTASQIHQRWIRVARKTEIQSEELRISVTNKRRLMIELIHNGASYDYINFDDIDIDGLIQHLLEVKQFLSEEDMIARLIGTK